MNEYGVRNDKEHRNELLLGAYSFKAPSIFTKQKVMKTRYVFALDTSLYAIESRFFHQVITSLKTCIDSLPLDKNIEICLFTFDTSITFYNVGPSGEI